MVCPLVKVGFLLNIKKNDTYISKIKENSHVNLKFLLRNTKNPFGVVFVRDFENLKRNFNV